MYVPEKLRREIRSLARQRCEYCLLDERCTSKPHEPDPICTEKHGGDNSLNNLCLSCFDCNRHKGSDLCSMDIETGEITPLFHPRQDKWADHFRINGAMIEGITPTGRVTCTFASI